MWWTVKNLSLRGIREGVLEGIGDIRDTNGEVVGGINVNSNPGCGFCQYGRGGLVKVNSFNLGSTIGTMAWEVAADIVTDIIDRWG